MGEYPVPLTELRNRTLVTCCSCAGFPSSDHFLSEQPKEKKDRRKKEKKKSKKKHHKEVESESEDDEPPVIHVVNTDIGEMPVGAVLSDAEDSDARPCDDPHRALDINLDE